MNSIDEFHHRSVTLRTQLITTQSQPGTTVHDTLSLLLWQQNYCPGMRCYLKSYSCPPLAFPVLRSNQRMVLYADHSDCKTQVDNYSRPVLRLAGHPTVLPRWPQSGESVCFCSWEDQQPKEVAAGT